MLQIEPQLRRGRVERGVAMSNENFLAETLKYHGVTVRHTGLEPRTIRPQASLPLTRLSLALDRCHYGAAALGGAGHFRADCVGTSQAAAGDH